MHTDICEGRRAWGERREGSRRQGCLEPLHQHVTASTPHVMHLSSRIELLAPKGWRGANGSRRNITGRSCSTERFQVLRSQCGRPTVEWQARHSEIGRRAAVSILQACSVAERRGRSGHGSTRYLVVRTYCHFCASHQNRQESKNGLCTAVKMWNATRGQVVNDVAGDSSRRNLVVRFRKIGSRGGAPAEPGRRWEANYKLKLGQALGARVPIGAAGGRELRRRENKLCLAVFGSMMAGALVPQQPPRVQPASHYAGLD